MANVWTYGFVPDHAKGQFDRVDSENMTYLTRGSLPWQYLSIWSELGVIPSFERQLACGYRQSAL